MIHIEFVSLISLTLHRKWHIGFCNWSYTPLHRGFDTHLGYYTGMEDYYYHNHTVKGVPGFDLRNQTEILTLNDSYSTFFYGNETLRYCHLRNNGSFLCILRLI